MCKFRPKIKEVFRSGQKSIQTVGTAYTKAMNWERTWLGRMAWVHEEKQATQRLLQQARRIIMVAAEIQSSG
jgi:hypothetical protein